MGKPDGLVVVPEGREAEFLAPLPVEMLWGVGPKTQAQLLNLGVHSIGDLATFSASRLKVLFGERGVDMAAHARAMDERPVQESREPKSVSSERTFARDRKDRDQLRQAMLELCADVARRLKKSGLAGRTVKLKMRWPDFTTITRQIRLEQHTDQEREIFSAAWALFEENWSPGKAVRLLGVGLSDLGAPLRQLSLFDAAGQPDHRLAHAIDEIRDRFGPQAVQRGRDLKL
jgi:DNA polymerase-4